MAEHLTSVTAPLEPPFTRLDPGEALDRGWMLPADWYTDPAILEHERERIFGRAWQYAGHASRLPEPGSFFTTTVGRIPVVVVRTPEGELAAHVNVCRHRCHTVADGEGLATALRCPYHGWTYELDGALRNAPRSKGEPTFDAAGIRLRPMLVDTWGPLIFVCADLGAAPLADTLGGVMALAAERGFDLSRHRLRARREFTIACNWKITLENNTECYHCGLVHPGFRSAYHVGADHYNVTAFERCFSHDSPPKSGSPGGRWEDFHLYFMWPNFMISGRGNDYFYTYNYVPVDPNTTIQVNEFYFPEAYSDADVEEAIGDIEQIFREDWRVFEGSQVGMRSGMIAHGQPLREEEGLLRRMQRLCYDAVSG